MIQTQICVCIYSSTRFDFKVGLLAQKAYLTVSLTPDNLRPKNIGFKTPLKPKNQILSLSLSLRKITKNLCGETEIQELESES